MTERLESPQDIADYLGVPIDTIYGWRSRGIGPRGMRVGRHVRYRRRDVDDWLDRQADKQSARPRPVARSARTTPPDPKRPPPPAEAAFNARLDR